MISLYAALPPWAICRGQMWNENERKEWQERYMKLDEIELQRGHDDDDDKTDDSLSCA